VWPLWLSLIPPHILAPFSLLSLIAVALVGQGRQDIHLRACKQYISESCVQVKGGGAAKSSATYDIEPSSPCLSFIVSNFHAHMEPLTATTLPALRMSRHLDPCCTMNSRHCPMKVVASHFERQPGSTLTTLRGFHEVHKYELRVLENIIHSASQRQRFDTSESSRAHVCTPKTPTSASRYKCYQFS
jgi:hypothetical protein